MKTKWIVWYAIFMHGLWGFLLIFSGKEQHTTAIDMVYLIIPNGPYTAGVLLLIVAGLALLGVLKYAGPDFNNALLVLPQQFLMMLSAGGAIVAMINSSFADGVIRPREFIIIDQCPAVLAMVFHSLAILENYATGFAARIKPQQIANISMAEIMIDKCVECEAIRQPINKTKKRKR